MCRQVGRWFRLGRRSTNHVSPFSSAYPLSFSLAVSNLGVHCRYFVRLDPSRSPQPGVAAACGPRCFNMVSEFLPRAGKAGALPLHAGPARALREAL